MAGTARKQRHSILQAIYLPDNTIGDRLQNGSRKPKAVNIAQLFPCRHTQPIGTHSQGNP